MKVKNINIQYRAIISKESTGIDTSIIEKLFTEVEIIKTSDTKYLFDFHDKKNEVYQTEFNFDGTYTKYKNWSKQFLVYFAFMVAVHREAHVFSRAILNSEDAEEFKADSTSYLGTLRKKASKFLLRMALDEIKAINTNNINNLPEFILAGSEMTTDYFINNIVKGIKSKRKESLATFLGLLESGNFFINFLSTSDWYIEQFSSVIEDDKVFTHHLVIKFRDSNDELGVTISTTVENTYKLIEQDINKLRKEKWFTPYFTQIGSIYKEPEITKLGGYNVIKNGDETLYLTDSFIISPVDDFSLFEKSKLIVAGVERILNIKHNDLQAKITYALISG